MAAALRGAELMIEWLDSAYPPNDAQIAAAKAAGIGGWAGYFAGTFILNGWSKADFDRVKAGGLRTMAYCSGWDDPAADKAQSIAWAVTICLDVEGGIRGDGPWVPPWLAASGSGLYGNYGCHGGRSAAFHVLAAYLGGGDPQATWWGSTPRPAGPCGWQWLGTHDFAGKGVDSAWFDDAIALLGFGPGGGSLGGGMPTLFHDPASNNMYLVGPEGKRHISLAELQALQRLGAGASTDMATADLAGIPDVSAGGGSPDPALVTYLQQIKAEEDAIKAELDADSAKLNKDLA